MSKSFSSFTVASVVQMTSTWRRAQKIIQFISIIAKRKRQFQSLTVIVSRLSFNWAKTPTEHMGMKNCLGPFFLTGIDFSQFSRKNGNRYAKTFCGRMISKKFYVLKTPWKLLPVNFKPEVTGNDDVMMTTWYSFCSSWLTDHDDGSYES